MRITDKRETAVYTDVVERNVDYIIIILLFLCLNPFMSKGLNVQVENSDQDSVMTLLAFLQVFTIQTRYVFFFFRG